MNISSLLNRLLARGPCEVFNSDMRVKIEATGLYTYPDISVVCGEARFEDEREDTLLNPLLIAEVLSPSTERYDRGVKFAHYRQIPSLEEYVLVWQEQAQIERFRRQPEGEWLLRVTSGVESVIRLASLEQTLGLREVYAKVEFRPTGLHGRDRH